MSLNMGVVEGRLPFDIEVKNEGEKNAFVGSKVSVKRSYKPEGEKYYPEDLLSFKAYGPKADFIGKYFPKGSTIGIKYEARVGEDWKDKDDVEHKGEMYLHVVDVFFPEGGNGKKHDDEDNGESDDKSSKNSKSSGSKSGSKSSAGANKPANPLLGGKRTGAPWNK